MRRRHLSNSFTRAGIDQQGSSHTPTEQSYFPTGRGVAQENGPFVGQMNHMTRHHNPEGRANVSMEVQAYVPVDPYSHSSMTETRSLTPVGHTHCTSYSAPNMHDVEAGLPNRLTGNGGPLKRKRSGSFYSAGGSSSSSSHIPTEKPSVDFHSPPSSMSSLTINGEDSSRNVRRRYRLELEPSTTRSHVPTHSSQFYHSAPGQHANGGQWNCVPPYASSSQRRISPSDISSGSRHEMSQVYMGGNSGDPFLSRHPAASSHGPTMREDHVNHSRRSESSYGNSSRYSHYAHGGTSSTNALHTLDNFSSRNYYRHCSPGGWRTSYRSGRPRLTFEATESHDRLGHHEAIMMMDQAPFYGNSRNFSDQYRDERLDIDNMSYEELLNLGERIGNVSTGLSEDNISKYLIEKYHCSDENQEEISCPICLEEYKNGDKIGRMGKCGHGYHVDCIKKWLLMKKLCPICKTECSN